MLWAALLVAALLVAPHRDAWAVQAALVAWLLYVPGRLALAALRVPSRVVRRFPVYVVAMSVLAIMLVGLVVDGVGTMADRLGRSRPAHCGLV